MSLTKKQIKHIDDFICNQNIKFLDIRFELIDHLASEYESKSNIKLDTFLYSKLTFIRDFLKRKRKAIHWSYQKQLWVQFFELFYKLKYIAIPILVLMYAYILAFQLEIKPAFILAFIPIVVIQIISWFYLFSFKNKANKKLVSIQYIANIMALPSLFLYTISQLKNIFIEYRMTLFIFCFLGILLNISGIIVVISKRKALLKKYSYLLK